MNKVPQVFRNPGGSPALQSDVQTLAKNAVTLHDSIKSLEHIAEIHERRS